MKLQLWTPFALAIFAFSASPAQAVFVGDGNGGLWNLDVNTNDKTYLGLSGVGEMFDIALDPTTSVLYGVTQLAELYSIDQTNGGATLIGSTAYVTGLTFDSSGTLYGSGGTSVFTIDTSTGSSTLLGDTGGFISSGDLAFDSSGNLFMSAIGGLNGDRLISVDTTTGAGTLIGDIGLPNVFGLNFLDSVLYGFTAGRGTITIDTNTGSGTYVALNGIAATGADGAGGVTPVPIPAAVWLFGSGLLGLIGIARRKK